MRSVRCSGAAALGHSWEAGYDRGMMSGALIAIRVAGECRQLSLRSGSGWLAAWAVALSISVNASCSEERFPPPHARTGVSSTTSGAGGGGGEGATSDAGPPPGPGPANLCECLAAYGGGDGRCADCFNEQAAVGAPCDAQHAGCAGDAACVAISVCLKACGHDVGCQRACAFPEDAGVEHQAFQRVLSCVCATCGATCAYGAPIECTELDGSAGGAGGGGAPGQ